MHDVRWDSVRFDATASTGFDVVCPLAQMARVRLCVGPLDSFGLWATRYTYFGAKWRLAPLVTHPLDTRTERRWYANLGSFVLDLLELGALLLQMVLMTQVLIYPHTITFLTS